MVTSGVVLNIRVQFSFTNSGMVPTQVAKASVEQFFGWPSK